MITGEGPLSICPRTRAKVLPERGKLPRKVWRGFRARPRSICSWLGPSSQEQTDLGPFADCHEKFALAWKYANEADKTRSKSRRQEFYHHFVMAFLYTLYAGDFDRSVVEAEAAIEMAPNEAGTRAALAS